MIWRISGAEARGYRWIFPRLSRLCCPSALPPPIQMQTPCAPCPTAAPPTQTWALSPAPPPPPPDLPRPPSHPLCQWGWTRLPPLEVQMGRVATEGLAAGRARRTTACLQCCPRVWQKVLGRGLRPHTDSAQGTHQTHRLFLDHQMARLWFLSPVLSTSMVQSTGPGTAAPHGLRTGDTSDIEVVVGTLKGWALVSV